MNRLVLGTAQFGMRYGIANKTGQPDIDYTEAIIRAAWDGGIREFDTAQSYGECERILGSIITHLGIESQIRINSKLKPMANNLSPKVLIDDLKRSLNRLGIEKLHCMMLHKESLIDQWDRSFAKSLFGLLEANLVKHIGISVYSPDKALKAIRTEGISSIQIPSNILDRRFETADVFQEADRKRKQIYVRSIFLQGLLLMEPEDLPSNMIFANRILREYKSFAEKKGISRHLLALGYVRKAYPESRIIIGVETLDQINMNLQSWNAVIDNRILQEARQIFKSVDIKVLNPFLWT